MKQEIKSLENKVLKQIDLNKSIFGLEVKNDIIHRMIRFQLAKKRLSASLLFQMSFSN